MKQWNKDDFYSYAVVGILMVVTILASIGCAKVLA
jgi:hypothetical protein